MACECVQTQLAWVVEGVTLVQKVPQKYEKNELEVIES